MVALPTSLPPQITLFADSDGMHLHLPPSLEWVEAWEQVRHRLQTSRPYWTEGTGVILSLANRELDSEHLQSLATILQHHHLLLHTVQTENRSTAVAAAALGYSVAQIPASTTVQTLEDYRPLVLHTTVRSGTEIQHAGTVVLLGDVNPGGGVFAGGNILIWGRLRGIAHAGCQGDTQAVIMALQLSPTQLRIADHVARAPEGAPPHPIPEVAYLKEGAICIVSAQDFQAVVKTLKGRV